MPEVSIFKWVGNPSAGDIWRVYIGDSCMSEDDAITDYVIERLKPFLDLIQSESTNTKNWVKWEFSKEEYAAMMGDSDGSE